MLFRSIALVGAGRTDTGVHAKQMFAHFDFDLHFDVSSTLFKLNSFLPNDVVVLSLQKVSDQFHARFDAKSRTYEYHMHSQKNPFLTDQSWFFSQTLHIGLMNQACEVLMEYTDFECFSKIHTDVHTFNCTIQSAFWIQNQHQLIFTITANRFLRNMVRAIVGTLINIGLEKVSLPEFRQIIESKNRQKAGFSVPAHGLFLTKVDY